MHIIKNMHVLRGDDKLITYNITDVNTKQVIDLTGAVIVFVAKERKEDTDLEAVINLSTLTSGITITDAVNGQFQVKIPKADTLPLEGNFLYDVQVDLPAGDRQTPVIGTLTVDRDVAVA